MCVRGANGGCQFAVATYFVRWAPNVCGFSVRIVLYVTLLAPRILRLFLDSWKACATLLYTSRSKYNGYHLKKFHILPTARIYVCCMDLRDKIAIFPHPLTEWVIVKMEYVYCAVRSVSLDVIQFYNRDRIFFLCGTVCIFRCNSIL